MKSDSRIFPRKTTINVQGELLDLAYPRVMGIINVTPDSFYSGSRFQEHNAILKQAETMLEEGATFIDVGGYSSRPGATHISYEEEYERAIPGIQTLHERFPEAIISIDTFRASIAETAVNEGASIINDISGGNLDEAMHDTVARLQVPYIMMHMRGTPQDMAGLTDYSDLKGEIFSYFEQKIATLLEKGVKDLILDPGFGFAKTPDQNYDLLKNTEYFSMLGYPLLAGLSRKSMIWKKLGITAGEALNGTTVLHTYALLHGANVLRVHDVKEASEAIELVNLLQS